MTTPFKPSDLKLGTKAVRQVEMPTAAFEPGDLMLGAKAIRQVTGIPEASLWRMARNGQLPCIRIGRRIAIRRSALAAWFARQEAEVGALPVERA